MSLRTPPILLADRIGIFIFASFSFGERLATLVQTYQQLPLRKLRLKSSKQFQKLSSRHLPSYVFRQAGLHKLGRLPPCRGYSLWDYFNIWMNHPQAHFEISYNYFASFKMLIPLVVLRKYLTHIFSVQLFKYILLYCFTRFSFPCFFPY